MKIATLAIITRDTKVLLGLKQGGSEIGEGTLNGPGGKFDPEKDKTYLDCVVRETEEEVEIVLNPTKLEKCAVIAFYAGGVLDFEVHVYRTSTFSGEPRATKSMVPAWYDIDNLPIDRMLESDFAWFSRAIKGEKFRADVHYRERAKGFIKIIFHPFTP
ncbi:MAG: NUDIX domain-containing protein [Patescibacteria group bacterium]|nr:NUDIX domain-containing protein [Patescibacteria group bacterium]